MNRKMMATLATLLMVFSLACTSMNKVTPKVMDDEAIEAEVRAKIAEDVPTKTFEVKVEVSDSNVVTLSGHAESAEQKSMIGKAAGDVKGVKRVINNIHVGSH